MDDKTMKILKLCQSLLRFSIKKLIEDKNHSYKKHGNNYVYVSVCEYMYLYVVQKPE